MANRWNISADLEREIKDRDRDCVYCRRPFSPAPTTRGQTPSWEHIINDETIIARENIALCCVSCNASKGQKPLATWLGSPYCEQRGISAQTIAAVAKAMLHISQG